MLDYTVHSASDRSLARWCLCWVIYTPQTPSVESYRQQTGAFDLTVEKVCLQSIRWKHCHAVHRFDGYIYCPLSTNV